MDAAKIQEAKDYIQSKYSAAPEVGMILGSGLGDLADDIEAGIVIPYEDIPHFPVSTVEGHAGRLVLGELEGKTVVAMQGRFHYYEGYSMQEVTFPVRVMKALGAEFLFVTNACGGMQSSFRPGDLMVIEDHINFTGSNPLIGRNNSDLGPRFPDMSQAYDPVLRGKAFQAAETLEIDLKRGVYGGIGGPNFLSRAELILLRNVGADVVGMSTVPEVIVAQHAGLRVLGVSCITDMAIGEEIVSISHEEVMETAAKTKPIFISLMKEIVKNT